MTYEVFENAIKEALIKTYIEEYGEEAWTSQTAKEKSETLHLLLHSFLTVVKFPSP